MVRCMGCMREYEEGVEVCPHCGYLRDTSAREAYHLTPGSILAGRYIAGRVLGFGGFGVTYIGWDAQLDRVVAIKEFLPTTFATRMPGGTAVTVYEGGATTQFGFGLERFVQEARRLAQFNGIPGITEIYDTFTGNNTAYIVMQYLQGRDVKQYLAAEGSMPYEQARDIVLKVCDTLAPVHAKGVIHRDISPDNIFLTDEGEVRLLDFGAARYESSVNSKSLSVILKSGYAPEEQYRSRGDQGPWTDVYALAATFYKMLTGTTPPDSMERAVRDEIREPSKQGVALPQSAENALMNALNIRKGDRTQSVEEFKKALRADGVERVKVKARRGQAGKVPLPAVVAMCIAGALLITFIALSASGVVNVGTVQPDNFGTPGQEGEVIVPDLAGKSEEEAGLTELVPTAHTSLDYRLRDDYEKYMGKTLRLRLVQYANEDRGESGRTLDLEQEVRLETSEEPLSYESIETITWEDMDQMIEDGLLEKYMQEQYEWERKEQDATPFIIRGNFERSKSYRFSAYSLSGSNLHSTSEGDLVGVWYTYDTGEEDSAEKWEIVLVEEFAYTVSEDGRMITMTMPQPLKMSLR